MNTETTECKRIDGWVLYDGDCALCIDLAERFEGVLARRGFELLPLQTPWVGDQLGLNDAKLLAEMRLLLPDGKVFGGADAVVEVSRRFWWAWPFYVISRMPVMKPLLRAAYRWIARRRGCNGSRCEIIGGCKVEVQRNTSRAIGFLPLLILPLLVLVFARQLPAYLQAGNSTEVLDATGRARPALVSGHSLRARYDAWPFEPRAADRSPRA